MEKEEAKQECKGSFKDCFKPLNECVCDTIKQERMYSEEEVNDLLEMLKRSIAEINHIKHTYKDKGHCGKYLFDCETIIENFKKK